MGLRINTNIASLNAQRYLSQTSKALARTLKRMSTGKRINSGRDDASGLAVGNGLQAQMRGMKQSVRNINEAFGFLNTAEGALQTQTEIVQRMRELAMQAANGTNSDQDREYLNTELNQLLNEFNRVTEQAEFNGISLVDGSFTTKTLQVGTNRSDGIAFSLQSMLEEDIFREEYVAGTGTFTSRTTMNFSTSNYPNGSPTLGDLDNDGDLDLVVNSAGDRMSILLNDGTGRMTVSSTFTTAFPYGSPVLVDMNEDGFLDIVANSQSGKTTIYQNNGAGAFQAVATLDFIDVKGAPVIADLNGDGNLDILVTDIVANGIGIRLSNGAGNFQVGTTLSVGAYPNSSPVVADINGDGALDIIAANSTSGTLSLRINNGSGSFSGGQTITVGTSPDSSPVLEDLNGDGHLDIVVANANSDNVSVLLNNGSGTFTAAPTLAVGSYPQSSPRLGDLDGDGDLDMVLANTNTSNVSVRLNNGSGTFTAGATLTMAGMMLSTPLLEDLNGDGSLDLLTANAGGSNTMSIRLNDGAGHFSVGTTLTTSNYPYVAPILGDLNNDGGIDIVQYGGYSPNTIDIYFNGTQDLTRHLDLDISDQEMAERMLGVFDYALEEIAGQRAEIGALQNRLEYAANNTMMGVENISAAYSQVMDADMALEAAELTKNQILQQSVVAVLAQANMSMSLVLNLLRA